MEPPKSKKAKKAEQFRSHVNDMFGRDLDILQDLFKQTFNFHLFSKARTALLSGNHQEFAQIILELKSEAMNVTLDIQKGVERPDELDDEPVATLPLERDNVILRPEGCVDIVLKVQRPIVNRCDPVECVECEPLPPDGNIVVDPTSIVIYAGPGAGKTALLSTVPVQYRGSCYDTDHLKDGAVIPPYSLVLTDRPDVKSRFRIAFVPYKKFWEQQCLSKCPDMKASWFMDVCAHLKDCFLIRRNCYLSDLVCLRIPGAPKKTSSLFTR